LAACIEQAAIAGLVKLVNQPALILARLRRVLLSGYKNKKRCDSIEGIAAFFIELYWLLLISTRFK